MRRLARLALRRKESVLLGISNTLAIGYGIDNAGWVKFIDFNDLTVGGGSGISPTSAVYADGKILVVGYQNSVSIDSLIYTPLSGAGLHGFRSVAYGNGKFVATADANKVLYSDDGVDWTTAVTPLRTPIYTNSSVCFGDGKFIVGGGDGKIIASNDGVNWTTIATSKILGQITYMNGKWFAAAKDLASKYVSNDGVTWTIMSLHHNYVFTNIVYSNGKYITVRSDGYFYISTDGINWTVGGLGLLNPSTGLMVKGLDLIYGTTNGYLVYSRDGGASWTQKYVGSSFNFKSMLLI